MRAQFQGLQSEAAGAYLEPSTSLTKQAAQTHHPELEAALAFGGRPHALDQELDVHGARLQPWLDHSIARTEGVSWPCLHMIKPLDFPKIKGCFQATLCLRGCCAPLMVQEEAQTVALWVGAGEARRRPARAVLQGHSRGNEHRTPASWRALV